MRFYPHTVLGLLKNGVLGRWKNSKGGFSEDQSICPETTLPVSGPKSVWRFSFWWFFFRNLGNMRFFYGSFMWYHPKLNVTILSWKSLKMSINMLHQVWSFPKWVAFHELFLMAQMPSKETRKSFSLKWFFRLKFSRIPQIPTISQVILVAGKKIPPWRFRVCDVFGMGNTWAEIRGCWWPPTTKIKRWRLESPGIMVFVVFAGVIILPTQTMHYYNGIY